jgi:hypothetical protein
MTRPLTFVLACAVLAGCAAGTPDFDVIIRGGTVYDGAGGDPIIADVGLVGDSIAAMGDLSSARGRVEIDAAGLAVAPGFINVLSWANESLLHDGRSQGGIRQGVTLEIFGEGWSMGPLDDGMKQRMVEEQGDIRYDVSWTTLGEYLEHLERRGVSPNVASFVGATTVRIHELGEEDRAPAPEELERMQALVRHAMEEGALGLGSSLIYAPAFYAGTPELVALAAEAGRHGGIYISHIRSEGNALLEAVDELITIAREAGVPAEIYHLKAAGAENWPKMDAVIERIDNARAEGLRITTNMYNYTAGATGLDAAMPPWVQEGGLQEWRRRLLQDPAMRARVLREMRTPTTEWESLYLLAGSPEQVLLVAFRQDSLKYLTGKSLAESRAHARHVAGRRGHPSRHPGRQPRRHRLLPDVRGQPQEADRTAVHELRLRCRVPRDGGRVPAVEPAPAGVRQLRAAARPLRPRRERDPAAGSRAAADHTARREPGAASARRAARRLLRRRRRVRPGHHHRPLDVRPAAPVLHGRAPRLRQRRAGPRGRRAHRRHAGTLRAGTRLEPGGGALSLAR